MRRLIAPLIRFSSRKDYYQILGVSRTASNEEIAAAYNRLAQDYFPGVSSTSKQQVDSNKASQFQDIAEAYAILSVLQSRNVYDTLNQNQPELLFGEARDQFIKSQSVSDDGLLESNKVGYAADSYAARRQEQLRKEREKFNVDEFGRYRGGLPNKDKGQVRGAALQPPQEYHPQLLHASKTRPLEAEQIVDSTAVEHFKVWSSYDKENIQWKYLYQIATVDYDYLKIKHYQEFFRSFRNYFIFLLAFPFLCGVYLKSDRREIINEVRKLQEAGQNYVGRQYGDLKVVVGSTGTLKLEESKGTHHH